ncbi:acyltransferase [Rasiella rasia]|nr:acyltransferase [Rasiella rasia]
MPNDKQSKFENGVYISDAKNLKIGTHVRVNEHVFLQGKISIGNYVMIAPNVAIYTNSHEFADLETPMVLQGDTETNAVVIENNAWLGRNVVVLPGITVGEGSIVGANSVVTKNVAPFTVVGGVPAKLIKTRS